MSVILYQIDIRHLYRQIQKENTIFVSFPYRQRCVRLVWPTGYRSNAVLLEFCGNSVAKTMLSIRRGIISYFTSAKPSWISHGSFYINKAELNILFWYHFGPLSRPTSDWYRYDEVLRSGRHFTMWKAFWTGIMGLTSWGLSCKILIFSYLDIYHEYPVCLLKYFHYRSDHMHSRWCIVGNVWGVGFDHIICNKAVGLITFVYILVPWR